MKTKLPRRSFLARCGAAAGALPFAGMLGLRGAAKAAGPVVTLLDWGDGHIWLYTFDVDGHPEKSFSFMSPASGGIHDAEQRLGRMTLLSQRILEKIA